MLQLLSPLAVSLLCAVWVVLPWMRGLGERSGIASSSITANQFAKLQKQVDSNSQVLKEVSEQLLVINSHLLESMQKLGRRQENASEVLGLIVERVDRLKVLIQRATTAGSTTGTGDELGYHDEDDDVSQEEASPPRALYRSGGKGRRSVLCGGYV